MDFTLELVVVPVSDVDRAKEFYRDRGGFQLDIDIRSGEDFRVVQLTPPGSACSIALMRDPDGAGSVGGLHLVVTDLDVAREELLARGLPASEIFHFEEGGVRVPARTRSDATTPPTCRSATPTATGGWCRRSAGRLRRPQQPGDQLR